MLLPFCGILTIRKCVQRRWKMDGIANGDIGGRLRRARQQRGLSLHEVAGLTKLSIAVLQAIERNDFASLPGGLFRKAFVRTLAVEVGLDPNEIAADYCARFEPAAVTTDRSRDAPAQYAIVAQPSDMPLRIEVAAIGWCWITAQADSDRAMYRLIQPGERVVLEGQRLISLRLGDAGSVMLSINDGARRSPGRQGEAIGLKVTTGKVEGLPEVAVESVSGD
jgi:transcriptional regulator with XRE-family HTH domain